MRRRDIVGVNFSVGFIVEFENRVIEWDINFITQMRLDNQITGKRDYLPVAINKGEFIREELPAIAHKQNRKAGLAAGSRT
ncbi:MAG: hypothetical protein BWX60_00808 [Candidatus Marinimicrobia bacterium ADurb.Bin030]|nr:MAG: hypothetical protein BWX60_00808 [Candidatus Marinimicrobia bacterium ADurb.Bin030]